MNFVVALALGDGLPNFLFASDDRAFPLVFLEKCLLLLMMVRIK
jgi:hypothetical protein